MTKFPRSLRLSALVAVTAIALGACGGSNPLSSADDAFSLNGSTYSIEDLDALNDALVAAGQYTPQNGALSQQDVATTLSVMIRYFAYKDFIAANGLEETQADIDKVEAEIAERADFASFAGALQTALRNLNVSDEVMSRVDAPGADKLRALYDKMPASAGVLCLSHILVDTEQQAKDVLARLAKGDDFATVAKETSTEAGADESGGALKNGDEDCSPLPSLQQSFDADFMTGAVAAKAGVPTGPVKSSFGYHVILSHAFDDVAESATRVVAENPGALLLAGHLAASNVVVNSKYGVWNGATGRLS